MISIRQNCHQMNGGLAELHPRPGISHQSLTEQQQPPLPLDAPSSKVVKGLRHILRLDLDPGHLSECYCPILHLESIRIDSCSAKIN